MKHSSTTLTWLEKSYEADAKRRFAISVVIEMLHHQCAPITGVAVEAMGEVT